ncbi:hypothetical protein V1525DRAFT_393833 [Lipomyces kononenkoae]|uniref:Uncharacterized protein n=1 Tax=Lipomyces kononenkoae TaxID=34357 RepID=A0ACC3TBZ4_LIPKO
MSGTPPKLTRLSTGPTPILGETIPPTPVDQAEQQQDAPAEALSSGESLTPASALRPPTSEPRQTVGGSGTSTPQRRHRPTPLPLYSSMVSRSRSHSRERGMSPDTRSPHMRVRFPLGNDPSSGTVFYPKDDSYESAPGTPPASGTITPPPAVAERQPLHQRLPSYEYLTLNANSRGRSSPTPSTTDWRPESQGENVTASQTRQKRVGDEILLEEDEDNEKGAASHLHSPVEEDEESRRLRYALANSGTQSAPGSATGSPVLDGRGGIDNGNQHIPDLDLGKLEKLDGLSSLPNASTADQLHEVARQLVRAHTLKSGTGAPGAGSVDNFMVESEPIPSGQQTPVEREDYVPPPTHVKGGILSSLLKLYNDQQHQQSHHQHSSSRTSLDPYGSGATTPPVMSGATTPTRKWYSRSANASTSSLAGLIVGSGHALAAPGRPGTFPQPHAPKKKMGKKTKVRLEDQIRITVHIAEILQRQRFILKLCRALMLYGAPTHRLEEYMKMTSRVLEIDGQFLYIPGCMIVSFGDASTHTSEMQLVRVVQGVNLSKLHETHTIYKEVVHDVIGVEEAMQRLDDVMKANPLYHRWLCVVIFGFSSAMVAPFAFGGRWIDMPIACLLGCIVGFLQLVVAPRSDLYSNVFEITASVIVSFLGRAFGSINDVDLFCFAAIAQGALALILPGYIILCGALELQSKNIVAGAVRMFYAIIYSLFLGFGITLGSAIYGWMDHNATSSTTCPSNLSPWYRFIFVPMFSVGLALVNQAHWTQLPVMVTIAGAGYAVSYFCNLYFSQTAELASAIACFVIGVLGNLYSRVGHGLAFAAMLPAIFVQVPSGLAAQGSLISGVAVADLIVSNSTSTATSIATSTYNISGTLTTVTATITSSATVTTTTATATPASVAAYTTGIWTVGMNMIQISIGIVVGLFIATLAVYPFGKKRSGLFTF